MGVSGGAIEVLELKRLMKEIEEKNPNVCIRVRLLGEMWAEHFTRIVSVTDKGVLLHDEVRNRLVAIENLSAIIQFEIDNSFQQYQPYFHYTITLSQEFA
jgi:hypothetical protein